MLRRSSGAALQCRRTSPTQLSVLHDMNKTRRFDTFVVEICELVNVSWEFAAWGPRWVEIKPMFEQYTPASGDIKKRKGCGGGWGGRRRGNKKKEAWKPSQHAVQQPRTLSHPTPPTPPLLPSHFNN